MSVTSMVFRLGGKSKNFIYLNCLCCDHRCNSWANPSTP